MARIFRDIDVDASFLADTTVGVLGYGSQGRAQALNLRDSGIRVRVGVRESGASFRRAQDDGFDPTSISKAARGADLLAFCLPDVEMGRIFEEAVRPQLNPDATLLFAHGFAIHYGLIRPGPSHDVVLLAPMGAGPIVRARFAEGSGVPGLVAVHQDASGKAMAKGLAYGAAIGCGRVAILETTFREETESDLFGEQAVLCGGIPELMRAAFETAVAGGISPEIAYIACVHEVKLIVDLIYAKGLDGMVQNISQTAEWGAYEAGPALIGDASRKGLEATLRRIQSGAFAKAWIEEATSGGSQRKRRRDRYLAEPIHAVGARLRPLLGLPPA